MINAKTLTAHYAQASFADDVEASLEALGKSGSKLSIDDLELVDEFHMGGRPATHAFFDACGFGKGAHLLDVGSGLGGPARVAAHFYGAQVDGVDLTPAYVDVANDLSQRVGLADRTRFVLADAVSLPFANATFDGGYSIHVGMNIPDKDAVMREVHRVLKPGAVFAIYDIMRIGSGELTFPLPWSTLAETSAVATLEAYRSALTAAGFAVMSERNRRPDLKRFAEALAGRTTPPPLKFRGDAWETKTANLGALVKGGVLAPTELIARKA